jgi:peptide/nickel transport system permease protein
MRLPRPLRSGRVLAGGALILLVLFCAVFAPLLVAHNPSNQDLLNILLPPAWVSGGNPSYLLGTDSLGRDVLARLLYGARLALVVAFTASLGAMILGAVLAHIAGYFGGFADWLIGRAVDVWMSFPPVVLSLILMVGLGTGSSKVVLAIILVDWTRFCRVLRADVLITARRDYVAAARLCGFTHWQILTREILPATLPLLITLVSLEMGIAVVVEAVLSFVGMGVGPSEIAWGQMIADARQNVAEAPLTLLAPMAAIFITVTGFNLLGDGLRRTLDVRLRETGDAATSAAARP